MAKFIVIKKRSIILSLIFTLICSTVLLSLLFFNNKNTVSVESFSNILTEGDTITCDFNGDGEIETLEISSENGNYIVRIKGKNKNYVLKTEYGSNFLGNALSNWSIKVALLDLSRDGIPEIIIQTNINSSPINHIFTWRKNNYVNIYTSTDNLLGILDSSNSKTPKILSLSSSKGDNSTNSYIINGDKIKNISFSKTIVPGLAPLQSFIDIIETPYEIDDTPDIFSSSIDSTELSLLWNLDKEICNYSFQSGYFTDTKWDSSGELTSLAWTLSFENTNKKQHDSDKKELILYLAIKKDEYNKFKICSIKK